MESGEAGGSGLAAAAASPAAVLDQFFPPCIHTYCVGFMIVATMDWMLYLAGQRRQ